ncbi:MAG: rhodanese-like domain-containing protein, partial [Pseudomonadota bacterium]|nr:rhodanese-like domain-containing protein [Pseudomonadota bacterium]
DRSNPVDRDAVKPEPAWFTAAYRQPDHPQAAQVLHKLDSGHSMLDARSPEEYSGKVSGGPRERPGRIPGAVNLPYDSLVKPGSGYFPPVESLRSAFEQAGVPLEGEQIAYCHTGHRASVAWFVAHELLGNEKVKLYDGSTVEWATDPELPLER